MYRRWRSRNLSRQLRSTAPTESLGLSASEFEAAFLREKSLSDRSLRSFSMLVFLPRRESDEGLVQLAEILHSRMRGSDLLGLLDQDVLAVLMPETDSGGAHTLADAVLPKLAEAGLRFDFKVCVYPGEHDGQEREGRNGSSQGVHEPTNGSSGPGLVAVPEKNGTPDGQNGTAPALNGHEPEEGTTNGHEPASAGNGAAADHPAPPREDVTRTAMADSALDVSEGLELGELRATVGHRRVQALGPLCCEPVSFRKRALDVVVSSVLLVLLSPLLVFVALAIKLTSPGPVFFRQQRAGQGGVPFTFYKFRSMYIDAEQRKAGLSTRNEQDGPIFKMKNDPRMTFVGKLLRRSSVDELPQLLNVLRGDMTLVGPRPPTLDEVEDYEPWQLERLNFKGGLTCIWQVSGRSEIGFLEWVRMDLRYGQRRGAALDLALLAKTAKAVVSGRGAY